MRHSRITELEEYTGNVRRAHWQADTLSSIHGTLGELYGKLNSLTDDFAEVVFGKDQNVTLEQANIVLRKDYPLPEIIADGRRIARNIIMECVEDTDEDLRTIAADILKAVNHTAYLLKVKV